ncbi:hypothetical protein RVR_566 [Actinacidiphila reveromycinica]|uniref:Thioesterase domain-containing protein n=1 Tax=Actinacidiphila reveromycinica TaxID=659352 RepID=A0A7U3UN45_9ACTN|nr:PaaI family thioesterase [Streptomyces sp. SN-593]BBA95633.1 hypothetical protein RVR_566 [Streptomyces sp. SN-593]
MEQNATHFAAPGAAAPDLPVLDYLRRQLAGTLEPGHRTPMRYPTAISRLLGFEIVEVGAGTATLRVLADTDLHGNQQGTVHGGFLVELADAAIGTARSTLVGPGESFTSIDLKATFLRPAWTGELLARAHPTHSGRTLTHYACEISRPDGKPVATVTSAVMTLRGDEAAGR